MAYLLTLIVCVDEMSCAVGAKNFSAKGNLGKTAFALGILPFASVTIAR